MNLNQPQSLFLQNQSQFPQSQSAFLPAQQPINQQQHSMQQNLSFSNQSQNQPGQFNINSNDLQYNRLMLNPPTNINLQNVSDNFQYKISQKSDPFSLDVKNRNRHKEVSTLVNFKQRLGEYESHLEENRKLLLISQENRNTMNEINKRLKNEFLSSTHNAVLLRSEIKKHTINLNELKADMMTNTTIVNDFVQYYEYAKKGKIPTIQLPSSFLQLICEKINNSLERIKQKIIEVEELALLQKKEDDEQIDEERDYEIFLLLIEELFSYYNHTAYLVIKFNENFVDFKTHMIETFKNMGYLDLEKNLEYESKKYYKDEVIENLLGIANKIEISKKLERENLEVIFIIKFY